MTTRQPIRPKAEGYNVKVGGDWFRSVAGPQTQIQIGTRDSLAPRNDDTGSIYNNVLDIGYAWGRTDVSGGEGLDWDPRQIALEQNQIGLDAIRYWDSEGINVARPEHEGDQYTMRLARTFEDSQLLITDIGIDLAVSNPHIYVAENGPDPTPTQGVVNQYDDWDGTNPATPANLPVALVVAMAASPNDTLMVVMSDGTVRVKQAGQADFEVTAAYTPSGTTKLNAQGIWYVGGRFIMSAFDDIDSAQLWELAWDGTDWEPEGEFDTASSPFWSVVESGPAIVSACGDGTVRTYTPDNASGTSSTYTLLPKGRTTMPHGELPILLGANAGVLLIMTTADVGVFDRQEVRIYRGEVLDARFDYVVGQMQLLREHYATEHEGDVNRNMTNTRDEIYFLVKERVESSFQDFEILLEALWRYDIVTGGLSRVVYDSIVPNSGDPELDPIQAEQSNLNALIVYDNLVGAINFTDNIIRISDPIKVQAFGYMVFPNITFGLNTPITWIATVVEAHDLVESGGQVELWYSIDPTAILDWNHPTWNLSQRLSSQAASNFEAPFTNLSSRTISLQLRMYATEGDTVSPKVTRIALRGIPAHRDLIMLVPFNISDYVSAPGRKPMRVAGLGNRLHNKVLDLVGQSVDVQVLDPPVGFSGIVNNVSEPVEYLASRGSVTRYAMVEFRGKRITGSIAAVGDAGMGLGWMGLTSMGLGQSEQEEPETP